jgi:CheY-like chemotaxis protein
MEEWKDLKILVVDDDPFLSFLVSKYLEPTEIQITRAENGKEAVQLCQNKKFDIVLMNIQMPVMDGFKATTEIRGFNKDIAIIAQTTYRYDPERFFTGGFTDYIFTPFEREDLLLLIKKHIKTY